MFEIHEDSWYSAKDDLTINEWFEYKQINTNKQITYYNDVLAFDIETSSFNEYTDDVEADTSVYDHLLGIKIKITQKVYDEFPDFVNIRKSLFGRIYFSKNDGISIDSLYHELNTLFPYYFPDDIYNPFDQLEHIIDVFFSQYPEAKQDDTKRSVMYLWGLAINGRVIIGRTWEEFKTLLDDISSYFGLCKNKRMIVWVHNLAYEFQFMKNIFTWEKVFAVSTRKPVYALTDTGIEFRCSYILSGLSLAACGNNLHKYKVRKLVGALDYDKVRHCQTPLTKKEIQYQVNDVLVCSAYIKECMEEPECDNNITKLPLTCTGYSRRYMRQMCLSGKGKKGQKEQFKKYHKQMLGLTLSYDEYMQCRRGFAGGFTHTSALHSLGNICYEGITSLDLCSAYPGAMCMECGYPMSKGEIVQPKTVKEFKDYLSIYCCLFDIKFINIKPRYVNENYISISKCWEISNPVSNNGRLVSADKIAITINEVDFQIIEKMYSWDDIELGTFRIYMKDYLPKEIILGVLQLFKGKTELKNIEGMEVYYQRLKGLLNSSYGMICTSILFPEHKYDNTFGWTVEQPDPEKAIKSYNKSKKRFLFWPWSLWITSYVRRTVLNACCACGDDYYYSDTDSVKITNYEKHKQFFDDYNKLVEEKLRMCSEHYNIPFEMFTPKTKKGVTKMLGVWEKENDKPYLIWTSIGAKRYLYMDADRQVHLTVSGVDKRAATPYLISKYGKYGLFKHFDNKLVIPGDNTGKLTHYYLDEPMEGYVTDYLGNTIRYRSESGIYLEKASYSFSMELGYLRYLKELRGEIF